MNYKFIDFFSCKFKKKIYIYCQSFKIRYLLQVIVAQTHVVKPRGCDVNENSLSDVCRTELGLSEEQLKSGQPLEQVIEQVSYFVLFIYLFHL